MRHETDDLYLRLAVSLGYLTPDRAADARARVPAGDAPPTLEGILIGERWILPEQARRVRSCLDIALAPDASAPMAETLPGSRQDGESHTTRSGSALSAPAPPPAADTDRYEIMEELGRGGMGVVYRARQRGLDRIVALKLLSGENVSADELERFRREARAAARLHHPGIIEVFDVGEIDGRPYLAMAHVDGLPLDRHLAEHPELDLRTRVDLIRRVAEAVEHAHANGIVHRDLKPANILIDAGGAPRVADFGLAKEVTTGPGAASITHSGMLLGTPQFMSPEQADGDARHIDSRSDIYSLGAVLYVALTGRPPFLGDTVLQVVFQILNEWPEPPSRHRRDLPEDLDAICLRALEKDRARRYATAAALSADLGRFLAGEPVVARPISLSRRLGRRLARHRAAFSVLAIALVLLVALAASTWITDRARRRAESGEAAALETLRKAGLVARVAARWNALEEVLHGFEASHYDSALTNDEHRAATSPRWSEIASFLADTPPDPTSQSAARALAGWARLLAGHPTEGIDWMRDASRIDPDLAHGPLLEALACFSEYTSELDLPIVRQLPNGSEFETPRPETDGQKSLRARIEGLVARLGQAKVWGREGAEDFRDALDALHAWQEGDLARADRVLSRALASPDLRFVAGDLRLARAKARYLLKRFDDGIEDLTALLARRPSSTSLLHLLGSFEDARATQAATVGTDARVIRRQAIDRLTEALRRTADAATYNSRGGSWFRLGEEQAMRGEDPTASYERSIADHTEAIRLSPKLGAAYLNRANALVALAEAEGNRGSDERHRYRQAIEDLGVTQQLDPGNADVYSNRATARIGLGKSEAIRGGDPRDTYLEALADCDEAIRRRPASWVHWGTRANVGISLAKAESDRGRDARPILERAAADAGEAIRLAPGVSETWGTRGSAYMILGQAKIQASEDPRPSLRRSVADQDQALALDPRHGLMLNNRGLTHMMLGQAEAARGGDPRPSWKAARADYEAALKILPDLWAIHASKGMLMEAMGDLGGAVAAFEEVVRLNPAHRKMRAALDRYRALWKAQQETGWKDDLKRAADLAGRGDAIGAQEACERGLAAFAAGLASGSTGDRDPRLADPGSRSLLTGGYVRLAGLLALRAGGGFPGEPAPADAATAADLRGLALSHLERAVDFGWTDVDSLATGAEFFALSGDPRWAALLERLRR